MLFRLLPAAVWMGVRKKTLRCAIKAFWLLLRGRCAAAAAAESEEQVAVWAQGGRCDGQRALEVDLAPAERDCSRRLQRCKDQCLQEHGRSCHCAAGDMTVAAAAAAA
jgi:hypothetical protein